MIVCAQLRVFINLPFELLELSRLFNPNLLKIDVADEFRALPFVALQLTSIFTIPPLGINLNSHGKLPGAFWNGNYALHQLQR